MRVVVIGAGAFGGWTALHLLRRGARVTLIDAWGPGHSRSSSGGETRVIRHSYAEPRYVEMAARSLTQWIGQGRRWGRELYRPTGVLFMTQSAGESFLERARAGLEAAGVAHRVLDRAELAKRYPQVHTQDLRWAIHEEQAGYLLARRACEAVVEGFVAEGGEYRKAQAAPPASLGGPLESLATAGGERLRADRYVFACGPWLARLFPDVLGPHLRVSRQEAFYFGTPPGASPYDEGAMPIWADFGARLWYGIPGSERRGFKIADDTHGPALDPGTAERVPSAAGLAAARDYLAHRFPGMAGAPLTEARVCQYTNTPDADFIVDRHPRAGNVWLVGGGSGHGFKHGPALGETVAEQVLEHRSVVPAFALARFESGAGQSAES